MSSTRLRQLIPVQALPQGIQSEVTQVLESKVARDILRTLDNLLDTMAVKDILASIQDIKHIKFLFLLYFDFGK